MATQTTQTVPILPEYLEQPTEQMANTLGQLMGQPLNVPAQQVAGFTPTQQDRPFLDDARLAQLAGAQTVGQGVQALQGMNIGPDAYKPFFDQYQADVTAEAVKEIDRQSQMAQNQLAGQAVKAGAFGGSRFGIQQSELARNAADLKSRRVFEDLSRNFQQAQASARAANQQRMQQGQMFGQLGQMTSGIGGAMAGLGAQAQQLGQSDVSQLMGIGGLQQQLDQQLLNTAYQNQLALQNAPFQQLSTGAGILQQLSPQVMGQQTIAPLPQSNPYLQAAGAIGSIGTGLGALVG